MQRPGFQTGMPVTLILLIVNASIFVTQLAAWRWFGFPVDDYFALSLEGLRHGWIWQLITFQFLHAGWLHLILNCWAIYVFGRELEHFLGVRRYLWLYFMSGVFGGLMQTAMGFVLPHHFGGSVVGASAGVFGLVAAYARLFPERPLTILLFFIIPVSMRAKFLLLFSGLFALAGILFPGDNIAHAAHLGGMITGIAFVHSITHLHLRWHRHEWHKLPRPLIRIHSSQGHRADDRPPTGSSVPDDYLSKEVDPILDKISAHGIQSLTARERQILESARRKMGRG
jgi:membrane associated rhomboid family serine protease